MVALIALATTGCSIIVGSKLDEKGGADSGGNPGDDAGPGEGGTGDGDVPDPDGATGDCSGQADGAPCGEARICVSGMCAASTCGDNVVDSRTEECDDGNEDSGDGCEPFDCVFTCSEERSCDDGRSCNGMETCDLEAHVCNSGSMASDGTSCTVTINDGEEEGRCVDGTCIPDTCGNEMLDGDEQCDDGNTIANDGCEPDCTITCMTDEDCQARDGNVCNGDETCAMDAVSGAMICLAGTALDCDDQMACTEDSCDPIMGCFNDPTPFDMDGDQHFVESCGGDDCDDTEPLVYGGNQEICMDGLDNDCNPDTPDEATTTWYVDCDGDTYAPNDTGAMTTCERPSRGPASCPRGSVTATWTPRAPTSITTIDCNDANATVNPGQTGWFTDPLSTRSDFDYNCSMRNELRYPSLFPTRIIAICTGSSSRSCSGSAGWDEDAVPACMRTATYKYCGFNFLSGSCQYTTRELEQSCH